MSPDGSGRSLWVANIDGTAAHALAPDLGGCQGFPAWSPDGTHLLFSRMECRPWTSLGDAGTRLYLADPSGGAPVLVDTGCAGPCDADSDGAFSGDGRSIVFVRLKADPALPSATLNLMGKPPPPRPYSDVRVLASLDLATGRVTELGRSPSWAPRWSPDGTKIVFDRDINTASPAVHLAAYSAVFVADADGRNVHRVSAAGIGPGWSPDGTRIVFQGEHYGWVGDVIRAFPDIYTIRPDGTGLRRLTTDQFSTNPEWSADGRIWFVRTPMVAGNLMTAKPAEQWVMNGDGSNAARASLSARLQGLLHGQVPLWQPAP